MGQQTVNSQRVALCHDGIAHRWLMVAVAGGGVADVSLTPHIQYAGRGRPTKKTPIKAIRWHMHASVAPDPTKITLRQHRKVWCVLGTSIPDTALTDAEVIAGSKG